MRKENLQFLQKINRNSKNKLSFKISKKWKSIEIGKKKLNPIFLFIKHYLSMMRTNYK